MFSLEFITEPSRVPLLQPKRLFLPPTKKSRAKVMPTTRGVPRPSPIQVLTAPDVA